MLRKSLIVALVLTLVGLGVGWYWFHKPNTNLITVRPDVVLSADSLVALYEADELLADSVCLGKVLEITGQVAEVVANSDSTITVLLTSAGMAQVSCQMSREASEYAHFVSGGEVVVRGSCSGKLMDVVLSNCVLVEK